MVKPKPKLRANSGGRGKFYALIGGIAVVALAAIAYQGQGASKLETFPVDPNLPAMEVEGYLLGNADAPVQVMEWADFECPGCMQFATVTEPDVRERLVNTGQVAFRFFFFPLTEIHPAADDAAFAAACAGDQDKFWEMHDAIFNGFTDWAGGRARNPRGVFKGYAQRIGANVGEWETCFDSDKHVATITAHKAEGLRRGVNSTPTFIIGDKRVSGAIGYDEFKSLVDAAAATSPRAPAPAPPTGDTAARTPVPVGTGSN